MRKNRFLAFSRPGHILTILGLLAIAALWGGACKASHDSGRVMKKPHFKVGTLKQDYVGKEFAPKEENFIPARSPTVYSRQKVGEGIERLYVGVTDKHKELILELAGTFSPPYFLLYVLHTSRCDNELARYQSPPLEYNPVVEFLSRFEDFLIHDSRHDLWLSSPEDKTAIVWDRHDVLFIYGPLDKIEHFLDSRGFAEGMPLVALSPHLHHYHPEYDQAENEVMKYFNWLKFPLQPVDIQTPKGSPQP